MEKFWGISTALLHHIMYFCFQESEQEFNHNPSLSFFSFLHWYIALSIVIYYISKKHLQASSIPWRNSNWLENIWVQREKIWRNCCGNQMQSNLISRISLCWEISLWGKDWILEPLCTTDNYIVYELCLLGRRWTYWSDISVPHTVCSFITFFS